ncbi:MAG: NAD(P)/FAD-dependent oxidoreductase [Acidimicrobiia bacterium]|nr:NAD(P)/FAD-dependent oxidoreductase [Acidimicrobiia bacterium]
MKKLLVLGAGTAGTITANKLNRRLDSDEWSITVVDQDRIHYYQPGFLFIPFGIYEPDDVIKSKGSLLPPEVELVVSEIDLIEPEQNRVKLVDGGNYLDYDVLIVATGTQPRPDETPGLTDGSWRDTIHDFYTFDGAVALADKLRTWDGGRLVVHITEMPCKCPVAPLEFTFLADAFFHNKGMRDRVELVYVTPLDGAFTKPIASEHLGRMLEAKKVEVETDFAVERVDPDRNMLVSYDEREIPYDLLVTVPVNMGAEFVDRSGLGDELNYVPVDKHTFLSKEYDNIFALGDAADLPTSKAGSVAHFAVDVFADNFVRYAKGLPMVEEFDGHANCFIESGFGKAAIIDFNYDTEPLPGKYPVPGIGPFSLLEETQINHWGKMMFRWLYWNVLLKGRDTPLPAAMTMAGKHAE